jgi:hypothetical protein
MKKRLFLLSMIVALISGCVTATQTSIKTDGILYDFAYVVGKGGGIIFKHSSIANAYLAYDKNKIFSVYDGRYEVHKVLPGAYVATDVQAGRGTLSANGQPLLRIFLESGKITYIGDISFTVSGGSAPPPPGMPDLSAGIRQSVSFTKQVQNNSEAVKKAIREEYPELAAELDAIFVYSPVQ